MAVTKIKAQPTTQPQKAQVQTYMYLGPDVGLLRKNSVLSGTLTQIKEANKKTFEKYSQALTLVVPVDANLTKKRTEVATPGKLLNKRYRDIVKQLMEG